MKEIINKISNEFIEESTASLRMLEDLAAMERYMAESYDGRIFIELIQNADDADAKRICVFASNGDLVVANDGRPFDENDITAICRSGASKKQRGENIGYRGVGFKSTTSISNEIIIYSADTYFTFSKKMCAERLGLAETQVPTVRIPFLYDGTKLDSGLAQKIESKVQDGFTTFFIFKDARIDKFEAEIDGFDSDWLLFLKNVDSIEIDLDEVKKLCGVRRKSVGTDESRVKILGTDEVWHLVTDGAVTIAFQYGDDGIASCNPKKAKFHCYLPTIDLTGFPFKINADFSTDPSRKHIINDDTTASLLDRAEKLIVKFVGEISTHQRTDMLPAIGLLGTFSSPNEFVIGFRQNIYRSLSQMAWAHTADQKFAAPCNLRLFPEWLNDDERAAMIKSKEIAGSVVSNQDLNSIYNYEKTLSSLGVRKFSGIDMLKFLSTYNNCALLKADAHAKIFAYSIKGKNYGRDVLDEVFIPVGEDFMQLKITTGDEKVDDTFSKAVSSILTDNDLKNLSIIYPVFKTMMKTAARKSQNIRKTKPLNLASERTKLMINKWKNPTQNCIASETMQGYSAKDVSGTEKAYGVISTSASGDKRYIAVKQVPVLGDSFIITESEYEAAQRLGREYFLFLVTKDTSDIEYGYIQNPYDALHLKRKVKEWEWICEDYAVNVDKKPEITDNYVDEKILKGLSKDYFNTEQRSLLNDILSEGKIEASGRTATIAGQVNSIADFYLGKEILKIDDDGVSIIEPLVATVKMLMK